MVERVRRKVVFRYHKNITDSPFFEKGFSRPNHDLRRPVSLSKRIYGTWTRICWKRHQKWWQNKRRRGEGGASEQALAKSETASQIQMWGCLTKVMSKRLHQNFFYFANARKKQKEKKKKLWKTTMRAGFCQIKCALLGFGCHQWELSEDVANFSSIAQALAGPVTAKEVWKSVAHINKPLPCEYCRWCFRSRHLLLRSVRETDKREKIKKGSESRNWAYHCVFLPSAVRTSPFPPDFRRVSIMTVEWTVRKWFFFFRTVL